MSKVSIEKNGSVLEVYHDGDRLIRGLITDNPIETYDEEREQLLSIVKDLKMIKRYEKGKRPKEGVTSFLKFRELLNIISIDVPYLRLIMTHRKNGIQVFLLLHKNLTKITLEVSYSLYDFVQLGGLLLAKVTRYLGNDDIKSAYNTLDEMVEWDRVWDIDYRYKRGLIQDELDRY